MNIKLFLNVLVYFVSYNNELYYVAANKSDIILMIKDFMEYYEYPNKIYTFTCWKKDLQADIEKILNGASLQSKINLSDGQYGDLKHSVIFVDMSCDQSKSFIRKMLKPPLFTSSQYWLLWHSDSNVEIQAYYLPINSNVYYIKATSDGYLITSVYKTSLNSVLVQNGIGRWTNYEGFREVYNVLEERKKRNLFQEYIKISYVVKDMDTISHLDDYQYNILTDTMTKLNYALMQHLLRIVNATKIDIFRRYFERQHFHDGMVDDLKNGDCDIGGTPFELLRYRLDELGVLSKTATAENKFIFRATPHSYISNVFTLPFDAYVWYSCFGLLAIIFFVAYVVVYWEWKDPIFKRYLSPRLCLRPHPVDIFLMEVGSAAQQGFESEPRSNSGRIVFIFTLISLMFLYTSFSASIVALLQSTTESLNTLENLFQSRIPVGFKENISMDYFNDLKYNNKSKEFYNKIGKPIFLPIEEGIKRVQDDFFAYYADTVEIYKYVMDWFLESEKCSLREISFKNTYVDYWLFMKKNSHHRDMFRRGINKIHETGIRSREYRRLFTMKPNCDSAGGNFESVGLADSYGAFLVMATGIVLSLSLFLLEYSWINYAVYIGRERIKTLNKLVFKKTGL